MKQLKTLLSALFLLFGAGATWAVSTTTIPGSGNSAVTLDLSSGTLALTGGHGEVQNAGKNFDYMCNGATATYTLDNQTEQKYTISFQAGTQNSGTSVTFTIKNASDETEYTNTVSITNNGNWTHTSNSYSCNTTTITTGQKTLVITFNNVSGGTNSTANVGNIVFTPLTVNSYNITLTANDPSKGTVSSSPSGSVAEGGNVTLTAVPSSVLYKLSSWSYTIGSGTTQNSSENPLTISNVTGDLAATATFADNSAAWQAMPGTLTLNNVDLNNCKIEGGGNIGYTYNGSSAKYYLNNTTEQAYKITVNSSYYQDSNVGLKLSLINSANETIMEKEKTVPKGTSWNDKKDYDFYTGNLPIGKYVLTVNFISSGNNSCNVYNIATAAVTATDVTMDEATTFSPAEGYANVTLTRQLKANVWNSLCLPFNMTPEQISAVFGTSAKLATMSSETSGSIVKFITASSITANQPCLIFVTQANTTPATIQGVVLSNDVAGTVTYGNVNFIGNYTASAVMSDGWFVLSDNSIKKVSGTGVTLNAFRAYFTTTAGAKGLTFTIDGDQTTAIEGIQDSDSVRLGEIYSITGARMNANNLGKGIYIRNGKKFIIK